MALKAASAPIPDSLDFSTFSRGHGNSLACMIFGLWPVSNVCEAERAYEAGFLFEIEETNFNEWIARNNIQSSLNLLVWIKSKGVTTSRINFHDFMRDISWSESSPLPTNGSFYPASEILDLFWTIYLSREGRNHGCWCCAGFCVPALGAFKRDPESLALAEESVGLDFSSPAWGWLVPMFIRYSLFDWLRLTHSKECCCYYMRFCSAKYEVRLSDLDEKQEEECYLRSRLDELVDELTVLFWSKGCLLYEFLEVDVQNRAYEVLDGEEEATEEDRARLRNIGVVLDEV